MMMVSLSTRPFLNLSPTSPINHAPRHHHHHKDKAIVILGPTGTGKSRLSIDLSARFDAEVINSDKIQFYRGLNTVTNKVTEEERRGVPHHLLGFLNPNEDFTARDFTRHANLIADEITDRGRLPVIVGGSTSMIEALANDRAEFRSKYDCCFLWVDASMPVLHSSLSRRVDRMVDSGLVDESREFFDPRGDYTRGIRRAIGVPEVHDYFRSERTINGTTKAKVLLLEEAIDEIKANTCELACRQLRKIMRLDELLEYRMHRLDATEALLEEGEEEVSEAWERSVVGPSTRIVSRFLCSEDDRVGFVVAEPSPPRVAVRHHRQGGASRSLVVPT